MNSQLSPHLMQLGQQLAGCYDNRDQAMAEPIWYVSLQAWWRPVPLFQADSITLFGEQANILQPDRPYRQRLIRLSAPQGKLQAQFYQFQQPDLVLGAGAKAELVETIVTADIQALSTGILTVQPAPNGFSAQPNPGERCCFSFRDRQGIEKQGLVELGFAVMPEQWHSYDKGINPETGQAIWGAMMGPYKFIKRQAYPLLSR
jgi:hypothetical protein